MSKTAITEFDRVSALYRKCRAYLLLKLIQDGGSQWDVAEHLVLTKETMHAFSRCVVNGNDAGMYADMDIPKYMFKDKPIAPNTWIDLQNMQLDAYDITKQVAMLVDPVTREFCFVFWDEAGQCSNPHKSFADAQVAYYHYTYKSNRG